jgi:hypothetical protein
MFWKFVATSKTISVESWKKMPIMAFSQFKHARLDKTLQ